MQPSRTSRRMLGIKDEYLALLMVVPLILSCMLTDPLLVSVEEFNNGQAYAVLDYASAPSNQSFGFNVSRYVAQGNWSQDGIMRNFTLQLCPLSGSPSDLTLYFPETGQSTVLWPGVLTGCEEVAVNAEGFDPYFNTTTGTPLTIIWAVAAIGGGDIGDVNFMMQREPRMYDPDEPVVFTLLFPGLRSDEVRYKCFEGDGERSATTPAKTWQQGLAVPGGLPIPPLPVAFGNESIRVDAAIWDLPCPAYGAEGEYTASVDAIHVYLNNTPWPQYFNYTDHFDSAEFNTSAWDVRTENTTGYAYHINNWTWSKLDLRSGAADNSSAIWVFYDDPIPTVSDYMVEFNIEVVANNSEMSGDWAAVSLLESKIDPGSALSLGDDVEGLVLFNSTDYIVFCDFDLVSPPDMTGTFAGPASLINITYDGSQIIYDVDGSQLSSCAAPDGDRYLGLSSDPSTDMTNGNASFDFVGVYSLNIENTTGWAWFAPSDPEFEYVLEGLGLPPGTAFNFTSDVIIRDCDGRWNCPYEFLLESGGAGSVNVSIVNITYENMLGYEDGMPTVTMDANRRFSWVASNSTITNSDVRYQSAIIDSRIVDSDIVLSDLFCTNVTNSELVSVVRLDEFSNRTGAGAIPLAIPPIRFEPNPCGEIVNSRMIGAFMLGGSAYNSEINIGGGLFMDFYDALFEEYMLKEGRMVINVTKYGANADDWLTAMSMDNDSIDLSGLMGLFGAEVMPVGCYEDTVFELEGFPEAKLGGMNTSFSCWLKLHQIHLIFDNVTVLNNSIGGPVVSLDNASFTLQNQEGLTNVMMRADSSRLTFWGVDTSSGPVSFNSSHQYLEDRLVALDPAFYTWTGGVPVTVGFGGASTGTAIYYYDGFTDDRSFVLENGVLCDEARCQNRTIDPGTGYLVFNVTDFSTYALADEDEDEDEGEDPLSIGFSSGCSGNVVTVTSGGDPVSGVRVYVVEDSTLDYIFLGTTDENGEAEFQGCDGVVRITTSKAGYRGETTTGALVACSECFAPPQVNETAPPANETPPQPGQPEPEKPEECKNDAECAYNQACSGGSCIDIPEGECGEFVNHAWVPYECCEDSICGEGTSCESHQCVQTTGGKQGQIVPPPLPTAAVDEVEGPDQECCLLGVCATVFGICWYWLLLLLILAGAAVIIAVLFRMSAKKGRR